MKKHFFQTLLVLGLIVSMVACNKNSDAVKPSLDPVKAAFLKQSIEEVSGFTVSNIDNIEEYSADKGKYEVVNFTDEKGTKRNFVRSDFPFELGSDQVTKHGSEIDSDGVTLRIVKQYEYWCTAGGSCTTCSIQISDPFGTPKATCSCSECHLHLQITN